MKRLFLLVLALLVLSGCGKQGTQTPETTLPQATQPDPGWYIPNSETERASSGAIRLYDIPGEKPLWISNIGADLLLATDGEKPMLTVLSGENCVIAGTLEPEFDIYDGYQMTVQGLAYYVEKTNEAVYLDNTLQVISRIALPEKPDGTPLFAPDSSEIFYCIGNDIRAYDTTRNITRPVKNQLVKSQELRNVYFGGKVLSCKVEYENGEQGIVYLNSQNGETLSTDWDVTLLETNATDFVAIRQDGVIRQELFGTLDGELAALNIPDDAIIIPAVSLNGTVTITAAEDNGVRVSLYDHATGCLRAAVVPADLTSISWCYADKRNHFVWFVGNDREGTTHIYRWDPSKSTISGEVNYKIPVYNGENPDAEGLSACEERVSQLNKTYGVEICLWKSALKETGNFTVVGEYQTEAIQNALDDLEKVMQSFPDKFLKKCATRPLRIGIVRSIDDGTQSVQFYKKTGAYIFLAVSSDIEQELIRALGYVVNSRVVSNSPILDTWSSLNPEGFTYGNGNEEFLAGENRAFADMMAMESVVDDRSSIFRYAMEEGNQEMFASETMQEKLYLLCKGIRAVWGWKKEEASFPWEQYLNESLAYTKK